MITCSATGCNSQADHYTELEDEMYVRFRGRYCTTHWHELWCTLITKFRFVSDLGSLPRDFNGTRVKV